MLFGYFCSSGRLRTSSPGAAVTSWVVVAKAKDAPAVFNLWKTFICSVDDYAWWKVPLVPAHRRLQGAVCLVSLRPAGQSVGSSLPDQHPDAAQQTSPFALCWNGSHLTGADRSKPRWHHISKQSLELVRA